MTAGTAKEPAPAPEVSLGVEADWWLQDLTAVSPERPIVWCCHGYRRRGRTVSKPSRHRAGFGPVEARRMGDGRLAGRSRRAVVPDPQLT